MATPTPAPPTSTGVQIRRDYNPKGQPPSRTVWKIQTCTTVYTCKKYMCKRRRNESPWEPWLHLAARPRLGVLTSAVCSSIYVLYVFSCNVIINFPIGQYTTTHLYNMIRMFSQSWVGNVGKKKVNINFFQSHACICTCMYTYAAISPVGN